MTEDELRTYAADVILDHLKDIEYADVIALEEDFAPEGVITDGEATRAHALINRATVRVSWPDHSDVYGVNFEDDDEDGSGDEGGEL